MKIYIKPTARFHKIIPNKIMEGSIEVETTSTESTIYNFSKKSQFNWDESESKSKSLFSDDEDK